MDPVSVFALQTVLAGVFLYGLYWVIRKVGAAGRIDAMRKLEQEGATPLDAARNSSR